MASLKEENVELRASSAAAGAEGGTCLRIAGFAAWLQAAQEEEEELHGLRAAR
jgi:hypothetical protein